MAQETNASLPLTPSQDALLNQLINLPDRPDNSWFVTKDNGNFILAQVVSGTVTPTNGLGVVSGGIGIGGTFSQDTVIDCNGFTFEIIGSSTLSLLSPAQVNVSSDVVLITADTLASFGATSPTGQTLVTTKGVVNGTVSNGQVLTLIDELTGEVEYQDVASTSSVDTINYTPTNTTGNVANETRYWGFSGTGGGFNVEGPMKQSFQRDVVVREFFVEVINGAGQVFSGSTVITLRKNGVDTPYSVTIPGGTTNVSQSFLVSVDEAFSSTDLLSYSVVTGSGTGSFFPSIYTRVQTTSTPIPDTFLTRTVTVTQSQVQNIFSTPVVIIPAVVGKSIVLSDVMVSVSGAGFSYSGGLQYQISLNNSATPTTTTAASSSFNSSITTANNIFQATVSASARPQNTDMILAGVFSGGGSAPTITAGSDITISVMYRLI